MLLGVRVHTAVVEGHVCFVRYLLAGLEDLADLVESRTLLEWRDVDLDTDLDRRPVARDGRPGASTCERG